MLQLQFLLLVELKQSVTSKWRLPASRCSPTQRPDMWRIREWLVTGAASACRTAVPLWRGTPRWPLHLFTWLHNQEKACSAPAAPGSRSRPTVRPPSFCYRGLSDPNTHPHPNAWEAEARLHWGLFTYVLFFHHDVTTESGIQMSGS